MPTVSVAFLPSSSSVSWDILHAGPLCEFHAKTENGIFWLAPTRTETDTTHSVTPLNKENKQNETKEVSASNFFEIILNSIAKTAKAVHKI